MQKTFKRLLISTLCVLMIFSAFPIATVSVDAAGQTAITLKQEKEFAYTNDWNRTVVQMSADGKMVYCVQPDLPAPPNGSYRTDNGKLSELTSSNSKYSMYRKALYYGYGGDGFSTSNSAFKTDTSKHQQSASGNTPKAFLSNLKFTQYGYPYTTLTGNNLYYMFTHLLVSYINYGDSKYKSTLSNLVAEQGYYTLVKEFYNAVKKAPTPPISTKLYMLNAGSKYQKVLVVRNGIKLQLQKTSQNTDITNGDSVYSLAGAKYNIYLDKACTDLFGTITTDEDGYGCYGSSSATNTDSDDNGLPAYKKNSGATVPVQTYYCKEVKAPSAYKLDSSTVYTFKSCGKNASDGTLIYRTYTTVNGSNVNPKDVPYIKLQLQKTSANTDITDGNSCYSLAGAKYNIYLDKACTDLFGTITTDEDGYGCYGTGSGTNTSSNDKGTIAYNKNSGVNVAVEKGVTYYCKEVEAPKGYDLDETVYTFKDSGSRSSGGLKIFRAYNGNEQPKDKPINDPIGISLKKRNAVTGETTNVGLEGAVFQIQYYSELIDKDCDVADGDELPQLKADSLKRTWYIETDKNGRAVLMNDYLAKNYNSDDFFYFNGLISVPLGTIAIKEVEAPPGYTVSDTVFYRRITEEGAIFAQETNTPIEVPIDEMPANGYIGINKLNESRQGVEGAVYGLYSDEAATTLVSELTTDKNGKGVFEFEAKVNQTYYIKEITAPAGYPLDETIYPVTPTEENTTVETAFIQAIYEESIKGDITIKKTSNDGVVESLYFAITDNLGNEYNAVATDKTGTVTVKGLPVYDSNKNKITYTVRELGFKTSPGTKSYGGFTWTVKAEDCIQYKGAYYEGVANETFSDCEYAFSRYYYGNQSEALKNEAGVSKTLTDNAVVTFNFNNTVPTTDIEILKDSYDSNVSGIYFNIVDQTGKSYGYIKTDKDGYASYSGTYNKPLYSFIRIPNSSICFPISYRVEEVGYRSPGSVNSYYFPDAYSDKIISEYKSDNLLVNDDVLSFDIYNKPDTGHLNIAKSSDDGDIANIYFKISAFEDLTDYTGECYDTYIGYDSSGNEIHEFILKTDSSGTASSDSFTFYDASGNKMSGLPVYVIGSMDTEISYEVTELGFANGDGTYTLPDRYIKNESVKFNLLENRSYTYECHNTTISPGKLQIVKTSEDNEVEDIWFNVKSTLGYDSNFVTDSDGFTPVIENLPIYEPATQEKTKIVEYTITELGYQNSDGSFTLPFKYNSPKSVTVKLNNDGTVTFAHITNTLKTGSLKLTKKDSSGNALSGSGWELYKSDGTAVACTQTGNGLFIYKGTADTATTCLVPTGTLFISNLPTGDYYLEEKVVPSGFMPYGKKLSVTISADNETTLYVEFQVADNKSILSETGGTGSQHYYLIGSLFTIVAINNITIYFYFKKRKSKGENNI